MRFYTQINSILGLFAAWLISLFGKTSIKPTNGDLKRAEFRTSTQHLGIRFNEKIRDVFRFRWFKISSKMDTCHRDCSEQSTDSNRIQRN